MAFLVRSSQFSLFEKIVPNIICESSLGLNNLTKKGGGGGELVFSKTFHTIIIKLQFNAITINKR